MKSSPLVDISAGALIGGVAVLTGVSFGESHFWLSFLFALLTVILTLLVWISR